MLFMFRATRLKAAFKPITIGEYMRMIADWGRETGLKYFIYLLILVLSGATSGCAVQRGWELPNTAPDFVAQGKMSIRAGRNQHTANFRWRQFDQIYAVDVWGPLGQGRTQFTGDAESLVVSQGNKVLAQGDPKEIMMAHLGWSIPVEFLPGWLQGEGVSEASPGLEVGAWLVSFSRFQGPEEARTPRRLEAQRGDHRIIVFIRAFDTRN
jgi:outer membrane lipoprotein LolB